jgi:hypothetical protein
MRMTLVEIFCSLMMTAVLIFSVVWLIKTAREGVTDFGKYLWERFRRRSAQKRILSLMSDTSRKELEDTALDILAGIPGTSAGDDFFTELRLRRIATMRAYFKTVSDEKLLIALEEKIRETRSEALRRRLKNLEAYTHAGAAFATDSRSND